MQTSQSTPRNTTEELVSVVEKDFNREWLDFSKITHYFRLLFSKKTTDLLESVDTFLDIDFEKLRSNWKTTIILDVDECIAPHHGYILPKNLEKIIQLHNNGWKIIIDSNMKKSDRYQPLEDLGIPILTSKYAKPHRKNFEICLQIMDSHPEQTVMIWDNFITDGGAMRLWIDFIKVKPVPLDASDGWAEREGQKLTRRIIDKKAIKRGHIKNYNIKK